VGAHENRSYQLHIPHWIKRYTPNPILIESTINVKENCENRNDPDLVQVFLKKWWVESDFKAPNLPLSLQLKGSGCHYT
jgi:hypothetical protein